MSKQFVVVVQYADRYGTKLTFSIFTTKEEAEEKLEDIKIYSNDCDKHWSQQKAWIEETNEKGSFEMRTGNVGSDFQKT
jgi:hypothetical protein